MKDYIRRFLIAGIMGLFIILLFLGGTNTQAQTINIKELTQHWIWPTDGIITDTFGTRHGHHNGIDIAGDKGTPISSVDKGIVTKSYYSDSYGNVVFIKHDNQLETVYAHLNRRYVSDGDKVYQGQIIGEMGTTGNSSGTHLHFEVHRNGWTVNKENAINPMDLLGQLAVGETVQSYAKGNHPDKAMATVAGTQTERKTAENTRVLFREESISSGNDKNKERIHVVQKGENLSQISRKYQTTVDLLKSRNKLKNDLIYPNQKLVIPEGVPSNSKYIVQPGDTLTSISKKTETSIHQLKEWNRLKSDKIYSHQTLIIKN